MAFSTQKEFFQMPFMNENLAYECRPGCVKLKSYNSTIDDRSWATDETQQSNFLRDLITCRFLGNIGDSAENGSNKVSGADDGGGGTDGTNGAAGKAGGSSYFRSDGTSVRSGVAPAHSGGTSGRSGGAPGQTSSPSAQAFGASAHSGGARFDGTSAYSGGPLDRSGTSGRGRTDSKDDGIGSKLSKYGSGGQGGSGGGGGQGINDSRASGQQQSLGYDLLNEGDSLLQCVNQQLTEYQKLMNIKTSLEKELNVSNDRLHALSNENKKIKEILEAKLDSHAVKDFYNKIQRLCASGKLTNDEENEMLQVHQKMERLSKAFEAKQAEIMYLKRLIEKLAARAKLDDSQPELEEQSMDVTDLQSKVNALRKEVNMLRQIEDKFYKLQQSNTFGDGGGGTTTDQDAENINAILKERNALREKCKSFKNLEDKVAKLQNKTDEADKMTDDLSKNLNEQTEYINMLENELHKMREYYDDRLQKAAIREQCLTCQVEDLNSELCAARCQACKTERLEAEIACLRNEIRKRDTAIRDYDCQLKNLMNVIQELKTRDSDCSNQTDELAFFTQATLEEIMKELADRETGTVTSAEIVTATASARQRYSQRSNSVLKKSSSRSSQSMQNCCEELAKLQKESEVLKCQLQEQQEENCNMKNTLEQQRIENCSLNQRLSQSCSKLSSMLESIAEMDEMLKQNAKEADDIGQSIEGTMQLVKDISAIQLNNQQLVNAVNTLNSIDDQKLIDDLKRQLKEETARLAKCKQENENLKACLDDAYKEKCILEAHLSRVETEKHEFCQELNKINSETSRLEESMSNLEKDFRSSFTESKDKALKVKDKKEQKKTAANERAVLDQFVKENTNKTKLLENDLRNLLDEFIQECGFCFCRLFNPKNKFYALSHKLYHFGLNTLNFRELAYLHKKIFAQAHKMVPGCLLDMILTENKELARQLLHSKCDEDNAKASKKQMKCCSCKSEICCDSSEEKLRERVNKIEKDYKLAKQYLENLKTKNNKNIPEYDTDTDANSTYRAIQ